MSTGPAPTTHTVDVTKFLNVAFFVLLGLGGVFFYAKSLTPVPAPPYERRTYPVCPDGNCRPVAKAFNVVCPYCRNTLSVQPSATGSVTGDAVGAVAKPATK